MDVDRLRDHVHEHVRANAADFGVRADSVRVEYVLNWGGFVNHSFHVHDGRRRLHLKLSGDAENQAKLRRWARVHRHLEAHYHAPPLLSWIEIPEAGHAGLVFEHVGGGPPDRLAAGMAAEIGAILQRLHADEELAGAIGDAGGAETCLDTFRETYLRRFAADLEFVGASRPPFVGREVMEWIAGEAAALEEAARGLGAFAEPALSPIHADLWLDNLLVAGRGVWYVLDWDEMTIGDPVLDLVTLVGPSRRHPRAPEWSDVPESYRAGAGGRERFAVYARAALLDWILDPLADYVDADVAPGLAARVRPEKERIHREALSAYRRAYGSAAA